MDMMYLPHRLRMANSSAAFTIVELLVTIAVIAVLVGLIVPALGAARESARSVVCKSNLRQLAVAAHDFTVGHNGAYPIAYDYGQPALGAKEWDYFRDDFFNPTSVTPGFLWQDAGISAVHQCPSYIGQANSPGDPYTGYNYNTSYIGGYRDFGQSTFVPSATSQQVVQPTHTVLFGDGQYSAGANKFMRAPWPSPHDASVTDRYAGTQGFRHLNHTTHVAYCDGHVAAQQKRHISTSPSNQAQIAPETGFLSQDNGVYDLR